MTAEDAAGGDGLPYRVRFVRHEPAAFDAFYNVVANPVIWFVQHDLWDLVEGSRAQAALEPAWEEGYVPVNEAFAEAP